MRFQPLHLILAIGLLAPVLHATSLGAQTQGGCRACTSSSSCGASTERGFCTFGCNTVGVCSCADALCERVLRPVTVVPREGGHAGAVLEAFSVTECEGRNELVALVPTPLGVAFLRLDPTAWVRRVTAQSFALGTASSAAAQAGGMY
jgi:hypothetical protein